MNDNLSRCSQAATSLRESQVPEVNITGIYRAGVDIMPGDLMFTICRFIAPVGWEELEVTRKMLYVAGEELEV